MNSVYHGAESVSLLGPNTCNIISDRLNNIISLEAFKSAVKSGSLKNTHVDFVGYILSMSQVFNQNIPCFVLLFLSELRQML